NPGMRSRIAFHVQFEDYSTEELCSITELMLQKNKLQIAPSAMEKLRKIYDQARKKSDYGNGRFVRKMLEEAQMNLAERILSLDSNEINTEILTTIEEGDITEPAVSQEAMEKTFGFSVA
ncbi:MAG: stage V sporulation protein K, partial [Lachnospiraceae bacterium]|nr:stage V sporulation protein K [Lachnospiraceae bacterium]